MGFPGGSAGKESACNAGDLGLIPGLGKSPGEGNGYPLQYSGLENSITIKFMGWQRVRHDWVTFTSLQKLLNFNSAEFKITFRNTWRISGMIEFWFHCWSCCQSGVCRLESRLTGWKVHGVSPVEWQRGGRYTQVLLSGPHGWTTQHIHSAREMWEKNPRLKLLAFLRLWKWGTFPGSNKSSHVTFHILKDKRGKKLVNSI